jgi:hypothetical protein
MESSKLIDYSPNIWPRYYDVWNGFGPVNLDYLNLQCPVKN